MILKQLTLTDEDRAALAAVATFLPKLIDAYDQNRACLLGAPKGGDTADRAHPAKRAGKHAPGTKRALLAAVRKSRRTGHRHPVADAANQLGLPHKTAMRWARDAGLVA